MAPSATEQPNEAQVPIQVKEINQQTTEQTPVEQPSEDVAVKEPEPQVSEEAAVKNPEVQTTEEVAVNDPEEQTAEEVSVKQPEEQTSEDVAIKQPDTAAQEDVKPDSNGGVKEEEEPKLLTDHREPLKLSGALDHLKFFDSTPAIGREFEDVNLVELLRAENSDELIRDLAITSKIFKSIPLTTMMY